MRIFQIVTLSELGGAQSVVLELANGMAERGHEVWVISNPGGKMWELLMPAIGKFPIAALLREISPMNDLKVAQELLRLRRLCKPDVIHLHSSKIGALGRLCFPRRETVYTIHGFDTILKANKAFLPVEKALKKKAGRLVAVCNYDQHGLRQNGILDAEVVYNGVRDLSQQTADSPAALRGAIESVHAAKSRDFFTVLCIARISAQKRFDLFRDIALSLAEEKVAFFWVGNQTEVSGLPANLQCFGELPDAALLNRYVDLFVLPTNYEGLPVSLIEALSFGRPAVASDVGGVGEILDGRNGFCVANTVAAFRERILFLRDNPEAYRGFSAHARETFERKFRVETMLAEYSQIYEEVSRR